MVRVFSLASMREVLLGKAGDREGHPVGVLAGLLDVVGRIGLAVVGPPASWSRVAKSRSKPTVER